eukprot:676844-Pleurochrysis_carterae.AAC.1
MLPKSFATAPAQTVRRGAPTHTMAVPEPQPFTMRLFEHETPYQRQMGERMLALHDLVKRVEGSPPHLGQHDFETMVMVGSCSAVYVMAAHRPGHITSEAVLKVIQLRNNHMVCLLFELAPSLPHLDRVDAIRDYRMNMPAVDAAPPPSLHSQLLRDDLDALSRDLANVRSDLEISIQELQDELDDPWPAPLPQEPRIVQLAQLRRNLDDAIREYGLDEHVETDSRRTPTPRATSAQAGRS